MKVITAPQYHHVDSDDTTLFLAGGITDCPEWQRDIIQLLSKTSLTIFNPRRQYFPMNMPQAAKEQIEWEFDHLKKANAILFWFPKETLCPIVLYELGFQLGVFERETSIYGGWLAENKHLFVGCHPEYARKRDVEIQCQLVLGKDFEIVTTLKELANKVKQLRT